MNNSGEENLIPCGDSMKKMDEILDKELEKITGGASSGSNEAAKGIMSGAMLR